MSTRRAELVELVTPDGAAIGSTTVESAHTAPGQLHRAFSVLLVDSAGRTLLQQRARTKARFPLRWANSCCGHPGPGESVVAAASRRLAEELTIAAIPLVAAGVYSYRAEDPVTGLVEHEYDHVLVGRVPGEISPSPDPAEVAATRWVAMGSLLTHATTMDYAPWFSGVLCVALDSRALSDLQ